MDPVSTRSPPVVCWHTDIRASQVRRRPLNPRLNGTMRREDIPSMADSTRRWSEVIPPHTALSFAALWDPVEGMVTFSGGHLLEEDIQEPGGLNTRDIPRDAFDGQSQVLTIDGLSLPFNSSLFGLGGGTRVPTVTFAYNALDDAQSDVDPFLRTMAAVEQRFRAQAQSARQTGKHVDWSQVRSVGRQLYSLGNRIFHKTSSSSSSSRSVNSSDDGFFEEVPPTAGTYSTAPVLVNLNLRSTFSMTTTSTTGYVDIDTPSIYSTSSTYNQATRDPAPSLSETAWSTLQGLDFSSCPNKPVERGRRLQKPRRRPHVVIPADPAEVLARPTYNHAPSPSEITEERRSPTELCESAQTLPCLRRFKSLPKLPSTHRASPVPTPKLSAPPSSFPSRSTFVDDARWIEGHADTHSLRELLAQSAQSPTSTSPTNCTPPPVPPHDACSPERGRTLRRQKSIAKVVKDGVGRLASKCRRKPEGSTSA